LARARAGAPEAIGAKAILASMLYADGSTEFATLVLPGVARLNSKALKEQVAQLRRFRFATPKEMLSICGVVPGCMPPFGGTVFPDVTRLYIDLSLLDYEWVGFNAADLERSIIVRSRDYVLASSPTAVLGFATTETEKDE
jgi:Ala-tRNA(Pro) deacylase